MLVRVLLFVAMAAPLCAQDEEVTKYLEELRAPRPPRDVQAEQRQILATLRQRLDEIADPAQKAAIDLRISESEQFLGNSDAAIAAARNAHDLAPADERITVGLAEVLLKNGHTAEVPALVGVDPSDSAALLRKAHAVSSPAVAVFLGEMAYKLVPDDAGVADSVGSLYMRSGDTTLARATLLQAVALAPQVSTYHYHLALASLQGGQRDRAQAELQQALDSNPTEAERANIQSTLAGLDAPRKQ
jgi:tetratricopeptide (TPR) repeat protein